MGYRVKTVSAMTGIPRPTLLAWERRYDILEPSRSPSGYREYSDADVAALRRLKALVDGGYSIGEAVELARSASPAPSREPTRAPVPELEPPLFAGHGVVVHAILRALLAFDRGTADRLLPKLGQVSFSVAIDQVFVPVMHALAEQCDRGEVSITQEHFVSGFCREHLLAMYHELGGGPEGGLTVACATPTGERHEFGLLVLALKLALAGHRVLWLGIELPTADLRAFLSAQRPRFLCLSFTRPISRDELVRFGRSLREGTPAEIEIVFGGPGVRDHVGPLCDGVTAFGSIADLEARIAALDEAWRARAVREPRASG